MVIRRTIGKHICCLLIGLLAIVSCTKSSSELTYSTDVVLIGGGIMSATLGGLLNELDENLSIEVFERLDGVALESSAAWNNAGTGHAAYSELNYTPELSDHSIDIKKALEVSESFEISKQFWAYLVEQKKIGVPSTFINRVAHMSFVWGNDNIAFLKKRYDTMIKHPLFNGMEYSDDRKQIEQWVPLIMEGRDPGQKVAATRMRTGVDVDFGELTRVLFENLGKTRNHRIHLNHEVQDINRNDDGTWTVIVKDTKENKEKSVKTKFVFIGAGGGALPLLQKSEIPEAEGVGGFPVGGVWLVTNNEALIERHNAKVYGKASVGSPPMSVPHLDTRYIAGKKALLFGPFATYSTKFLKQGSWLDLPSSVTFSNAIPMLQAGFKNFDLVTYLIGQVLLTKKQRLAALQEYFPKAVLEDWRAEQAGQRVQIIKKDPEKGGILQFGTELISSRDGTLVALLGASPGASIAVKAMINVLETSFPEKMKSEAWQTKLRKMIPSYGRRLSLTPELLKSIQQLTNDLLNIE